MSEKMPNALVQLQAHLTMRAQRAIQKCLSAATFVSQQRQSRGLSDHAWEHGTNATTVCPCYTKSSETGIPLSNGVGKLKTLKDQPA
jgi:hypothetical protein